MTDEWSADYFASGLFNDQLPPTPHLVRFLTTHAGAPVGSRVLELAAGFGRNLRALQAAGYVVEGVERVEVVVEKARELSPALASSIHHGDARTWVGDTPSDAVLIIGQSLGYGAEEDDQQVLRTAWSNLRPGGSVVVETLHAGGLANPAPSHAWHRSGDDVILQAQRYDFVSGRLVGSHESFRTHVKRDFSVLTFRPCDVRRLLRIAGFGEPTLFRGYRGEALTPDSPVLIAVAHKTGGRDGGS
jgi:SAM-dependent methyltransferase